MPSKVMVVPGLAVRRYAEEPVERLRQAGNGADLRPGLSWPCVPVDIADHGCELGTGISAAGEPVDVLAELTVVVGEHHHLTSYACAAALAASVGAALRLAPSGAHPSPTKNPDGFLELVDDLLDGSTSKQLDDLLEPADQRR